MRKAFLVHSSTDGDYVREVASLLGRTRAHIDMWSFRPGEDFRDAVRRALDDSVSLAFFASEESLRSSWCKFELDEGELRDLRGALRASLAILIGDVDPEELPPWLRRGRAVRHTAPAQSARTIEALLWAPEPERHPFLGRSGELQRGVRKLSASDPSPRILIAGGLEGVGRRTYLRHLLAEALDLELGPTIVLGQTATLEDLYIEALTSSVALDRRDAERQLEAFRQMAKDEQAREVGAQLAFLALQGSAPCIVDRDSMLDSSSGYQEHYRLMLERFLEQRDAYLCLIHRRTPHLDGLGFREHVLIQRLKALAPPDAQALVSRLLREIRIHPSAEQAEKLGGETAGYPPAAYYLASLVEDYGLDLLLGSPERLQDFHSGRFAKFLEDLRLEADEREILSYLSSEITLPLHGIAAATGNPVEQTAKTIAKLVDLSVVEVVESEYMVAAPIQATVLRTTSGLDRKWYERAFARLEDEYWREEGSLPPISVVDATLRAGLRIGKHRLAGYGSLVRPSLLINAALEMYHQQAYERALEYTERAESMGGATSILLEVQIKSLARLRRFGEARTAQRRYREFGERRKWYLDGFIERRAGQHERACERFQRGYAAGDRSMPLLRDYADSLLKCGAGEQALRIALEARGRGPGDVFVLDLIARIAIAAGSEREAEEALDELEAVDSEEKFILHRRAWFLIRRRGTGEAARQAAKLAARACERRDAPLEAYVAHARALIIMRDRKRYEAVREQIEKKGRREAKQILNVLECSAALQRGDWRRGERELTRAGYPADRTTPLRIQILEKKAEDQSVVLSDRKAAKDQARHLRLKREDENGSLEDLLAPTE